MVVRVDMRVLESDDKVSEQWFNVYRGLCKHYNVEVITPDLISEFLHTKVYMDTDKDGKFCGYHMELTDGEYLAFLLRWG